MEIAFLRCALDVIILINFVFSMVWANHGCQQKISNTGFFSSIASGLERQACFIFASFISKYFPIYPEYGHFVIVNLKAL